MMTWQELLKNGKTFLADAGIEDYEFDALQLILTFFEGSGSLFSIKLSETVTEKDYADYIGLLERRASKEPLQYIIGSWDFYKSQFYVGEGVLIPRPETEELVESVIELIRTNGYKTVYDLCSGSGCIGLSIAKECPSVTCYLFELFDDALYYTNKNLEKLGLSNVKIIKHDVLSGFNGNIENADIIVSNPPYIESREISSLQDEVLKEPITALDGGTDGLEFYRAISENWTLRLKSGGMVAFECGESQSELICEILGAEFITYIEKDIYGIPRFVFGKKQ